jgi:carbonic anhydrase
MKAYWPAQQRASAKDQYPAAVLLTCAETILDLRIGDIFNSRVADNVEISTSFGSMEFACKLAGDCGSPNGSCLRRLAAGHPA